MRAVAAALLMLQHASWLGTHACGVLCSRGCTVAESYGLTSRRRIFCSLVCQVILRVYR